MTSIEDIIQGAIGLAESGVAAADALDRSILACGRVSDAVRRKVNALFADAIVSVVPRAGTNFNTLILEHALKASGSKSTNTRKRNKKMTENAAHTTITQSVKSTKTSTKKKWTIGESYDTVSTMGLQLTEEGANVPFQFSRKTGRAGVEDIPAGTSVTYVAAALVYDNRASSKRMVFTLPDGRQVAGVSNHIDVEDPYNVQAKERADVRAAAKAAKDAAATKVSLEQPEKAEDESAA